MEENDILFKKNIKELCSLTDQTPTALFYVSLARRFLLENGFTEVSEKDELPENLNKFFVCRDEQSILAFNIQDKSYGKFFTTSLNYPTFKISQNGYRVHHSCEQVNTFPCGKGMWLTWPDRDLTVAGRAFIKDSENNITSKLVYPNKATAEMPMLAIHLKPGSGIKTDLDIERDFRPVFGFVDGPDQDFSQNSETGQIQQSPVLMKLISEQCNRPIDSISNFELSLISAENTSIIGVNDEMICSQRISSIMSSIIALQEFIQKGEPSSGLLCFYAYTDDQEIFPSRIGPDSNFLDLTLQRLGISKFDKNFFFNSGLYGVKGIGSSGGRGLYYYSDTNGNYQSQLDFINDTLETLQQAGIGSNTISSRNLAAIGPASIAKRFSMPSFAFGIPIFGIYSIRETVFIRDLEVLRNALRTLLDD